MPLNRGVSIQIKAIVLTETDVKFQQALDDTARRVFQMLKQEYEADEGCMFTTFYSGPRLVVQICPPEFEIKKAAELSPRQFQALVDVGQDSYTVDLLIARRLELIEAGRFHEARELTGDTSATRQE